MEGIHETSADANENVEETAADVRGFNLNPFNTSNTTSVPLGTAGSPLFDPDALYYDMTGDKFLIILNQHTFQRTRYFRYQQPTTRTGTDKDVKSLTTLFRKLEFHVVEHRNFEYDEIYKAFKEFTTRDHSRTSCVCVAILTHGDKGGELHAADRPYLLSDIIHLFEQQPGLVNKPKLFFVQACRGGNVDAGNTVQLDSVNEHILTVPTHADFLILYSTVEDYLSYRDTNGSWMIQALCNVIATQGHDLDLLHMITLLNRQVAYEKVTYVPRDERLDNKKQMPETRFSLTKLLKFH